MNRRTFIALCATAAALAVAFFRSREEEKIYPRFTLAVYDRLSYLKIDKDELHAFIMDDLRRKRLDRSVDEVARRFLLSTDFFISGMDEERPVKFLGRFDPYTKLCSHPFAAISGRLPTSGGSA